MARVRAGVKGGVEDRDGVRDGTDGMRLGKAMFSVARCDGEVGEWGVGPTEKLGTALFEGSEVGPFLE